jgi:hypothetical protein
MNTCTARLETWNETAHSALPPRLARMEDWEQREAVLGDRDYSHHLGGDFCWQTGAYPIDRIAELRQARGSDSRLHQKL